MKENKKLLEHNKSEPKNQQLTLPMDMEHDEVFIDGTKLESRANRYTFVWRKTTEKYLAKVKDAVREEFESRGISGNVTLKKFRELVTFQHKQGVAKFSFCNTLFFILEYPRERRGRIIL